MVKGNGLSQWSLTLLRAVLGIIFVYHGYLKLFVPGGFKGAVSFFAASGIVLPAYSALLAAAAEFLGGLLLLIGLFTKWASIVLFIEMLVAFFMVHLKNGFSASNNGYEFVLLILAALAVVLINGAGSLSAEKFFKNKSE